MTSTSAQWWRVDLHPEQISPRPIDSPEWRHDNACTVHADTHTAI